jgi:hypothetical protein
LIVKFRDEQLEQHFGRTMSLPAGGLPEEQRQIRALMDAYGWFHLIEGEQSPRVAEAIEHLLSPELRSALRDWYKRAGDDMNPAAMDFRERLSELSGEKFG